jgi:hypothetical protein
MLDTPAQARCEAVEFFSEESAVNNSVDLLALTVALALLALVFRAAVRTRSPVMRITLFGFAAVVIALMLWNLAVRGGLHAV